jgi:hypothetical protein
MLPAAPCILFVILPEFQNIIRIIVAAGIHLATGYRHDSEERKHRIFLNLSFHVL